VSSLPNFKALTLTGRGFFASAHQVRALPEATCGSTRNTVVSSALSDVVTTLNQAGSQHGYRD